jgi:hypothetical protein
MNFNLQHVATSSSAPTLVPAGPDANGGEWQDLYIAALTQLLRKVPETINRDEYDAFIAVSRSPDCTTDIQARDLLQSVQADGKYRGKFHEFFECLHKLLGPLRVFKSALDTLCQVESPFCLVWGSVKLLIEVRDLLQTNVLGKTDPSIVY